MGAYENGKSRYAPYSLKTPTKRYQSVVGSRASSSESRDSAANMSMDASSVASTSATEPVSSRGSPAVQRVAHKGQPRLSQRERQLDFELRRLERRRDTIVKAVKYQKTNESHKIEKLTVKWRNIAQMASNYLLNSMQLKIDRMGGMKEWNRQNRQRETDFQVRILEEKANTITDYMESEGYSNLSDMDKREIEIHLDSLYTLMDEKEADGNMHDEGETEFDMKMMYGHLKLDYDLVYEDQSESK